jgi:DNA-binding NtrC family response regulator
MHIEESRRGGSLRPVRAQDLRVLGTSPGDSSGTIVAGALGPGHMNNSTLSVIPGGALAPVVSALPHRAMLGDSPAVTRLRAVIEQVAASEVTALVTGESGSGKELVAREIHARSRRASGRFVAINCAAVTATLLESELFGHVRGAFTDARSNRDGLFVQAGAGTLFLDEVGEMPLEMQAKLLRAVEERAVRPVGSDTAVPVHVRLITATNRSLDDEVAAHRFRSDLYYRLNVVEIRVPPLRERGDDVLLLARWFLKQHAEETGRPVADLTSEVKRCLVAYAWPGNVRELHNCMLRAVTLSRAPEMTVDDLPARVREHQSDRTDYFPESPEDLLPMEELQRRHLVRVLAAVDGNKARAARILAIDRRTLYRLASRLQVR